MLFVLVSSLAAAAVAGAHVHRLRTPEVLARRALFANASAWPGFSLVGAVGAAQLAASPAAPRAAIANVTVAWSGVASPQSTDWIAQYCVGAPLPDWGQWSYVTADAGWASGSGRMTFIAVRSTCDIEFRLFRDPSPYTQLGVSNAVSWGPPQAAYQLRVAYGAPPQTAMAVSWTSAAPDAAWLLVGAAPGGPYTLNVSAAPAVTYAAKECCQAPATTEGAGAWTPPGFFHHASVAGLAPNTRYFAVPVQAGVAGDEISFKTAKALAADAAVSFVAYGDMAVSAAPGAVETSLRVSALLDNSPDIDFLVHVGDLGYAEGNVAIWDEWMSYIEPIASRLPYHVSIGNRASCAWRVARVRVSYAATVTRHLAPFLPSQTSTITRLAAKTTRQAQARCFRRLGGTAVRTAAASAACPHRGASPCHRARRGQTACSGTVFRRATCTWP